MKKITERERARMAMMMIDEISAEAQTTHSEKHGKELHDSICEIYRIAHSISGPKCRKNHPGWLDGVDAAIRAERKAK